MFRSAASAKARFVAKAKLTILPADGKHATQDIGHKSVIGCAEMCTVDLTSYVTGANATHHYPAAIYEICNITLVSIDHAGVSATAARVKFLNASCEPPSPWTMD